MATITQDSMDERPPPRRQIRAVTSSSIPFYRDIRVIRFVMQVVFAVLFLGGLAALWISLTTNLNNSDVALDFGVYSRRFGAGVSEGLPFNTEWGWVGNVDFEAARFYPVWYIAWLLIAVWAYYRISKTDQRRAIIVAVVIAGSIPLHSVIINRLDAALAPYLASTTMTRALITGFSNTIRVVIVAAVASTILGVLVGIALLSNNYLIRRIAVIYTEIFRNTSLLIQLILFHRAALLLLPTVQDSITSPDKLGPFTFNEKFYILNVRGHYFPKISTTPTFQWLAIGIVGGLVCWFLIRRWRVNLQETTGTPAYVTRFALPVFLICAGAGWLIAGGWPLSGGPFTVDYPQAGRFNIDGGSQLTTFFVSLFIGLTLYTSAFIADIVKAGIQSVPRGQIEAARSVGLSGSQVLSMVILPQALRMIIPPLGNQYVNLGKNSSLGIAVSYADTYLVVQLANNESGQSVPFFAGLIVIYLVLSLTFATLTNMVNRLTERKER